MRKLSVLVAAGLLAVLAVAVPVVVATLSGNGGSGQAVAAVDPDTDADIDTKADAGEAGRGGPPPWAHAGGKDKADKGAKHAKDSLDAWKSLTPAEREKLMTRLSQEHEDGMKTYQACRTEGRTDCVKPLPPGLAKRQAAQG